MPGRQPLMRSAALALIVALASTTLAACAAAPGGTQPGTAAPARPRADVDPALAGTSGAGGSVAVIVQQRLADDRTAVRAVASLGGHVTRDLPIIEGFAATLPATAVDRLAKVPAVRAITLDRTMRPQSTTTAAGSNVRSVYPQVTRASGLQASGITGRGVTVALIDTGIAAVPDLAGRVLPVVDDITGATTACENLSGEPGCDDSFGHGTFIAGIIAGNGAASGGSFRGMAPEANLVSVKIAGRSGAADVSNVLAAIQWVVSFRDRYGIKVLNLSLGTDGTQSYRTDPLNYAVERAWAAGITVVVAASNRGPAAGTIAKPGDDPFVITVGAVDDGGTVGSGDDSLPNFSSRGPTAADGLAKPDIVAPGAHIVSLRAVGSAVDTQFPSDVGGGYRRGSGTSMATGVVSGAVALLVQARPGTTPDRAKFSLTATARPDASNDRTAVGAGLLDAAGALTAPPGSANFGVSRSNGLGSLDASRGSVRVTATDPAGTVLSGLVTAQLLLWDPVGYVTGSWSGSSWYGSSWYGSSWYGSSWYGSSWYGSSWYGSSWYGQPEGSSWYGSSWYGSSWYGGWE